MVTINTSVELERGCGYRQPGGKYLVGGEAMVPCERLPVPLGVCPCCNQGIKPTRGFTWIEPTKFIIEAKLHEKACGCTHCFTCPVGGAVPVRAGLIWIGTKFYKTPEDYMKETMEMGLSRRISTIPKDLVVGETWVFLAHRDVPGLGEDGEPGPGFFTAFVPQKIEYIVKGDETEEELEKMEKRGLTLVKVQRAEKQGLLTRSVE